MEEESEPKWEGKASVELSCQTAEQVWPLLEDFCSINKWFPNMDTCYQVEGVPGEPGLIRYCASGGSGEKTNGWCKEKLLKMDPIERCFSYQVVDGNIGFENYVATIRVTSINGDGCQIEWSFVSDPIKGWTLDGLVFYVDSTLRFMANKMQEFLKST